jgi:hypothetical protein
MALFLTKDGPVGMMAGAKGWPMNNIAELLAKVEQKYVELEEARAALLKVHAAGTLGDHVREVYNDTTTARTERLMKASG